MNRENKLSSDDMKVPMNRIKETSLKCSLSVPELREMLIKTLAIKAISRWSFALIGLILYSKRGWIKWNSVDKCLTLCKKIIRDKVIHTTHNAPRILGTE